MPISDPSGAINDIGMMSSSSFGMPTGAIARKMPVIYTGKLSGFLDVVTSRYGVYWEWEGNGVKLFKTKTQTFRLAALPGDTSLTSSVSTSSGGGGGSTGGASTTSSSEMQASAGFSGMSVWKGMEDSIKAMLSSYGKIAVTPATGTITVDDTPPVLERVGRFIDEQNMTLSRQVVVNVRVLAVDLTDSDEYGINWDLVYQNVNHSLGYALGNTYNVSDGASNLTFQVLNNGSFFNGSSAIIGALSKQGRVSQVTSASVVTINNQPAPIQVGRQTSYLQSSTTTIGTGGAGNTVTLSPGTVTTGFSMSILPHILDNKKMMLQYSGDISSLVSLEKVDSGDSSIQTPEIDTRNFLQRVIMNSGETLVVTGFEQFDLSGKSQGVGDAENIMLGGGVLKNKTKSVIVVLIQPILGNG